MPITRNTDQKSATLETFYRDLSGNSINSYAGIGKAMLSLLELINQTFKETLIWGLTSVARLVLQNEDDWKAEWYVMISAGGMGEYYFEYLLPADKQPWDNAYVRGQANSLEEAKKYLLIAMKESGGWSDHAELKQLLLDHNIKST